jgi:hypothetical protein
MYDATIHTKGAKIDQMMTRVNQSQFHFLLTSLSFSSLMNLTHPRPPNPGEKPKPTPIAYAKNKDDKGYPMINFCEAFMNRRKLSDAILYGKAQPSPNNLDLAKYDNRAQTFLVSTNESLEAQGITFID